MPTILGELKRHFRDRTWAIHISRSVQESIARVEKTTETLRQDLGRFPSVGEVAAALRDDRRGRDRGAARRRRLAACPRSTPRAARGAAISPTCSGREDAGLGRVEDALWIEQLAEDLTPREREILRLRFVEDLVQREIAERVGLSQMHVSRVLRQALAHLADAA